MYLKSRIDFDASGFELSTGGTGEKSVAAGAGKGTNSERDNFRVSNKAMLGEIWNRLKERDIYKYKYFLVEGL